MKLILFAVAFVAGGVCLQLLMAVGAVDSIDRIPGALEEPVLSLPTYLSFLSVMLTAVTAVLAALAIGIGIIAAYTFKELKDEARLSSARTSDQVSRQVASEVAAEALSEVKVRAMILELYAKADKDREQMTEWGNDPSDNEER